MPENNSKPSGTIFDRSRTHRRHLRRSNVRNRSSCMLHLLSIAAGGGFGSVLRYLVAGWGQRLLEAAFPLGTLIVNLSGCFLIGFLNALFSGPVLIREE